MTLTLRQVWWFIQKGLCIKSFFRSSILLVALANTSVYASDTEKVIDVHDLVIRELHNELRFCEKTSVHSYNICIQQELVDGQPAQIIRPWWDAITYVAEHTNTQEPTITNVERLNETSVRIHYRE